MSWATPGASQTDSLCNLTDGHLWKKAMASPPSIGHFCSIQPQEPGDKRKDCEFYVEGRWQGQMVGVPFGLVAGDNNNNTARVLDFQDGCIVASGKRCHYQESPYYAGSLENEPYDFCTGSMVANGAGQIRYAMAKGYCSEDGAILCADGATTRGESHVANPAANIRNIVWTQIGEPLRVENDTQLHFDSGARRILSGIQIAMDGNATVMAVTKSNQRFEIYRRLRTSNKTSFDVTSEWQLDFATPLDDDTTIVGLAMSEDGHTVVVTALQVEGNETRNAVTLYTDTNNKNGSPIFYPGNAPSQAPSTSVAEVPSWTVKYRAPWIIWSTVEDVPVRETVLVDYNMTAVINGDGSRLAYAVRREEWQGDGPFASVVGVTIVDWKRSTRGVTVWEPPGYVPPTQWLQMDAAGATILFRGRQLLYGPENGGSKDLSRWQSEILVPGIPGGVLSPDGMRLARAPCLFPSLSIDDDACQGAETVSVYQRRSYDQGPSTWDRIAVLEASNKNMQLQSAFSFGSSMQWNSDGTVLAVGAPNEIRVSQSDKDGASLAGNTYFFQESNCSTTPNIFNHKALTCQFEQVGVIPTSGRFDGKNLALSADGNTLVHSYRMIGKDDLDWGIMTYQRTQSLGAVTANGTITDLETGIEEKVLQNVTAAFSLLYTIAKDYVPSQEDYGAASVITASYIDQYLARVFQGPPAAYVTSETIPQNTAYSLLSGAVTECRVYTTFEISGENFLAPKDITDTLESAFTEPDLTSLLEMLALKLPEDNLFSTATNVRMTEAMTTEAIGSAPTKTLLQNQSPQQTSSASEHYWCVSLSLLPTAVLLQTLL